ncbi:hypothetical protein B0E54_02715 [Micromonospora sp. MH99]|nr:hypothetical protein [Micromonospora sp. MH99]
MRGPGVPGGAVGGPGVPGGVLGPSSCRNRLGCSSWSSPPTAADATALTSRRWRARLMATWKSRRSSSSRAEVWPTTFAARAPPTDRPASTSTSRSDPSRLPRRRRSGQMPSCTPAIATRSHSRPFAACAVSSRTAAPRSAVGAMVSAGRSWASTWSRKTSVRAPGSRSVKRAAASKSTSTASRSRSAASARRRRARSPSPAAGRPWAIAPAQRSASPLASQTSQSTVSAVAPGWAAASRAVASSPATACAGSAHRRSMPARSVGSRSASTISSPDGRRSPPASARARRP